MDQNERSIFPTVGGSRNNEVTLRWQRSAMFIFIHSTGFSVALAQYESPLLSVISIVGFFLGLIWALTNQRTEEWINFWNKKMAEMEDSVEEPLRVKIYSSNEFKRISAEVPTFNQLLMILSVVAIYGWILVFLYDMVLRAR